MASTLFQDYNQNNPIVATWLNDINGGVYSPGGVPKKAVQSAAAWVRFAGATGVIAQSSNISSVVRNSTGNYTITYASPLTNSTNCYEISTNQAGFNFVSAEAVGGVTINCNGTANTPSDPGFVSVVIFGAN